MHNPEPSNEVMAIPSFATTMRGYDRLQVDDYIDMLQESLSESQVRTLAAEDEVSSLRTHLEQAARAHPATNTQDALAERVDHSGTADTVAARVQTILAAAEAAASTLLAEADTDRENARRVYESAEEGARQHAAEMIADARDTVERLTRRAEIERSRRDNVRRQLTALRSMLEGIDEPETGEIDLTALDTPSLQPVGIADEHAEGDAQHETGEDLTVLLALPR